MQLSGPDAQLRRHLCNLPLWHEITRLGIGVSGGSDSMALLHLLRACAAARGVALEAATVDHGLRPEAAAEAGFVADSCGALGIRHETLRWAGWDGRGNLQAEARAARYRLLADWAQRRGLDAVALAHTRDDQAETFLMRLAREAGVDGLSAMASRFSRDGAAFWRPVLPVARADLRDFLSRHGQSWRDDPSNENRRFDRVKARQALAGLADLGIDSATLFAVAGNLADAREALRYTAQETARRIARIEAGDVVFDREALIAEPHEIVRRLLVAGLVWVSTAPYPPRRDAILGLERAIAAKNPHTLHGCLITTGADFVRISREARAVEGEVVAFGRPWDKRWQVTGPGEGCELRALGEALKDCPDWRETGFARATLLASPAVWRGENLVAAPVAGFGAGFSATIDHPQGDFFTSVLSH